MYNASAKTDNGRLLYDNLMAGPVIQPNVVEKIISFRLHPFVMACEITKMYRQIKIHQEDWPYQMFLWRPDESSPIQELCLTTVTFGEASAPFTAIRTLKQIALDFIEQFPIACSILEGVLHRQTENLGYTVTAISNLTEATKQVRAEVTLDLSQQMAIHLDLLELMQESDQLASRIDTVLCAIQGSTISPTSKTDIESLLSSEHLITNASLYVPQDLRIPTVLSLEELFENP